MRLDSLLRWDTIGTPLFKIYLFYLITSPQKLFETDFTIEILNGYAYHYLSFIENIHHFFNDEQWHVTLPSNIFDVEFNINIH